MDDNNTFKGFGGAFGFSKANSRKQEAVTNDRRLNDLATYVVTKGLTISIQDHYDELLPKFAELKGLVRRGSFTLDQLEDMILSQYAIVKDKGSPLDDIEFLEEEPEPYYLDGDEE